MTYIYAVMFDELGYGNRGYLEFYSNKEAAQRECDRLNEVDDDFHHYVVSRRLLED